MFEDPPFRFRVLVLHLFNLPAAPPENRPNPKYKPSRQNSPDRSGPERAHLPGRRSSRAGPRGVAPRSASTRQHRTYLTWLVYLYLNEDGPGRGRSDGQTDRQQRRGRAGYAASSFE